MIKNVIFDLDGTLLDTREGIIESAKYAAKVLGLPELSYETMLTFVGPPIQNSFMNHYGCDAKMAQEAANVFRDYYKREEALFLAKPYDGIFELCQCLKDEGIRMAVATYKREDYAVHLLKHFGFDRYCDPMHGADNNNVLKKSDIVRMCQEEMGAGKTDTVLIGDTENDAVGAKNADISFVAVTYGFGFQKESDVEKYPCIGLASTPMEILDVLKKVK
ncbi:MAG: HAD hydrolase-like protein [Lachnospiraceae bacterium]|nr:HAD hydrolase-like protein [Lachnospiraceae bacterium]